MPSRWFRISFAEAAFGRFLATRGSQLEALRAPDAVEAALEFYRDHRAQHARTHDEGDALLWQWGPDTEGQRFTVDLGRQLIREGDDEPIVQLCLTLAYRWTPGRRTLGRGRLWCFDPAQLPEFERELRASAAYRAISTATPVTVTLRTETV